MTDLFRLSMSHKVGVGGWKCYCCRPSNRKLVKKLRRMARRRIKQDKEDFLEN